MIGKVSTLKKNKAGKESDRLWAHSANLRHWQKGKLADTAEGKGDGQRDPMGSGKVGPCSI